MDREREEYAWAEMKPYIKWRYCLRADTVGRGHELSLCFGAQPAKSSSIGVFSIRILLQSRNPADLHGDSIALSSQSPPMWTALSSGLSLVRKPFETAAGSGTNSVGAVDDRLCPSGVVGENEAGVSLHTDEDILWVSTGHLAKRNVTILASSAGEDAVLIGTPNYDVLRE